MAACSRARNSADGRWHPSRAGFYLPVRALSRIVRAKFRAAIAESRIGHVEEQEGRFRYRQPSSHRERTMTRPILEFMRRFLQPVRPRGVRKVRYYGFLSPSSAIPWAEINARLELARGFDVPEVEATLVVASPRRCRHCGGARRFCRVVLPGDSALPALSSRAGAGVSMLTTIATGP